MAAISIKVNLPLSILREGKRFVAYSPALDLSTSGRSYGEARQRFAEAVDIFFDEVLRRGTLGEVLRELGWHRAQSRWVPPVVVSQETQSVRLPARV